MKGHVRDRPKGSGNWYAVISMRDPTTGKRKLKWHSLSDCGGVREAQRKCAGLIAAMESGYYVERSKMKLAQYLEGWLRLVKESISPRTYERYAELVTKYLVPALGDMPLSKLDKFVIADAYLRIKRNRTLGKGELSARTVLHCHRVLSAALKEAVPRHLPYNPAADAKRPKVENRDRPTYSLTQAADLLESLRGSWMHVPAMLGILCGIRRGEIAALRWGSVDLDRGQLAVVKSAERTRAGVRYKEPKSGQARTVALSPAVVAELRAHRLLQAEQSLALGVRLRDDSFVVAQADGSPYDPDSISKGWRQRIIKSPLPRIRFHDLRHTHASHMLAAGVHPKIASERLGHSRVGITLDMYSHVVEGLQESAVSLVDGAMAKALQRRKNEVG
jgi:integrase